MSMHDLWDVARRRFAALLGGTPAAGGGPPGPARELATVRGFAVVVENGRADIATADVLARLDEALALVERWQPWRVRHLRRDLAGFLVTRYPCRGAYFPDTHTCMTELTFLARRDIGAAVVASSIVHEGIHARVHRMAERFGWRDIEGRGRAKEERLCRQAELAFGRALPGDVGAAVVERALATLEMGDAEVAPVIDWGVAAARVEEVDRASGRSRDRAGTE